MYFDQFIWSNMLNYPFYYWHCSYTIWTSASSESLTLMFSKSNWKSLHNSVFLSTAVSACAMICIAATNCGFWQLVDRTYKALWRGLLCWGFCINISCRHNWHRRDKSSNTPGNSLVIAVYARSMMAVQFREMPLRRDLATRCPRMRDGKHCLALALLARKSSGFHCLP